MLNKCERQGASRSHPFCLFAICSTEPGGQKKAGLDLFTGLVEDIGSIREVIHHDVGATLRVESGLISSDVNIGDSICINGCCLTVVKAEGNVLDFEAGTETLSRTNLGGLAASSEVNLERSLQPTDRMGGHFVSGHVDAVGKVAERNDEGEWSEFWFEVPTELTLQMASKGSVAVDGISLTLVEVESNRFSVALIPHTLEHTTLGKRQPGDQVNIETDILAKYVQKQLQNTR